MRARKADKSICLLKQKMSTSELPCSFSSICKTSCDISRRNPNYTGYFTLNSCLKDIRSHLKRLNAAQKCVASEGELILARAGLLDEDVNSLTICPKHRDNLGMEWKPSRKCQHPLHGKKTGKPELGRGVNLKISKEIMAKWHVLIPIGAGKYTS